MGIAKDACQKNNRFFKGAKDWYYASPVGNCIHVPIQSLLCAASHLQSNYYIPEICIREMIQHIYGGLLLVAVIEVPFHL